MVGTIFCLGGSISSLLQKFGRLSEAVCAKYTEQILQGLKYLHENKIVHRGLWSTF